MFAVRGGASPHGADRLVHTLIDPRFEPGLATARAM
jgi:hypothetical protein